MKGGRPLRFLGMALGGWATMRVALLLPDAKTIPALVRQLAPAFMPSAAIATPGSPASLYATSPARPRPWWRPPVQFKYPTAATSIDIATPSASSEARFDRAQAAPVSPSSPFATIATPFPRIANETSRNRLAASAWLLARGGPGGTLSGGQLGASQAGIRVTYAIGESRRFALAARFAAPLAGRGREAALGVEWQPTRWPIRLIAEQRFVLDGGRGGPTIGVICGYGPAEITPGVRFETYAQAGAIARARNGTAIAGRIEGFVDAAARLTHPIVTLGGVRIDGGIGAWASAQRDAKRLDIGPTLGATVPIDTKSLRLSLDWRERIGGEARPGSGPAFSIGTDF